jgi:hypothetical protein
MRRCLAALTLAIACAATAQAQNGDSTLYRVFLADGTALASYGEWARVDDRIVFSMPLAASTPNGELHLVSIAADRVDWARTERYADAVRASRYAATRGDADFAQLSADVAATLNQVAVTTDPAERLRTAERARGALANWPGAHHGYRTGEVREFIGVLDEVISGLRAASGAPRYDLALTATTTPPPAEPLLPSPDGAQLVEHLMAASAVVDTPTERVSLLQTVVGLLDRAVDLMPATWAATLRSTALGKIAEEQRIDTAYGALRDRTLAAALRYANQGNVRALERLRGTVDAEDRKLGQHRATDVTALMAALDAHLQAGQQLRLAQDRWLMRIESIRAYQTAVSTTVRSLELTRSGLQDIRALAGPEPRQLQRLADRLFVIAGRLARLTPPSEVMGVHAVFRSACELAESAVRLRLDAVADANLEIAQRASSAAAGALMLLGKGRADLESALRPPISPRVAASSNDSPRPRPRTRP